MTANSIRTQAAFVRRDEATFWQLTDKVALCAPNERPAERPEAIDTAIRPLTKALPCPLCSLSVNDCECDPNAYGAAVYAALVKGEVA